MISQDSQHVAQTLRSSDNPTAMVLQRIYRHAFVLGADTDPYADKHYRHLKNLEPVQVGQAYKGDAVEFMNGTLHDVYLTLQELTQRLADSVDTRPFAGEHIISFIERVANKATQQMLVDEA
jgi:hypothetical protein